MFYNISFLKKLEKFMKIETKDLILKTDISKEDIEKIHQNVFSQNETAKYMLWRASDEIE